MQVTTNHLPVCSRFYVVLQLIGHRSFVGTLLLDYNHSNPCMLTFVYILHQAVSGRIETGGQNHPSGNDTISRVRMIYIYMYIYIYIHIYNIFMTYL